MCILVESNYSEKNTEGREKNPIDHLLFAPLVRDPFFFFLAKPELLKTDTRKAVTLF